MRDGTLPLIDAEAPRQLQVRYDLTCAHCSRSRELILSQEVFSAMMKWPTQVRAMHTCSTCGGYVIIEPIGLVSRLAVAARMHSTKSTGTGSV